MLVAWASRTGNTANLAQRIKEILEREGLEVALTPVSLVDWRALDQWSALVFGSPTYGSGDLHPDWDKPERLLREMNLAGWPAAAFGCGNPHGLHGKTMVRLTRHLSDQYANGPL